MLRVLVDAHVGAVHHLHHLAVDAAGGYPLLVPQFLPCGCRPREVNQFAGLLAELGQGRLGDIEGNIHHRPVAGLDAHVSGHRAEFRLVADPEAVRLAFGYCQQG